MSSSSDLGRSGYSVAMFVSASVTMLMLLVSMLLSMLATMLLAKLTRDDNPRNSTPFHCIEASLSRPTKHSARTWTLEGFLAA